MNTNRGWARAAMGSGRYAHGGPDRSVRGRNGCCTNARASNAIRKTFGAS